MQKLLIAENSEAFTESLVLALGSSYEVYSCSDDTAVLELLNRLHPELLVINLSSLCRRLDRIAAI